MGSTADCAALYALATPKLYRDNGFRILGLNVEASARQIARRVSELEMLVSFESSALSQSAFSPNPPATTEDVRGAGQRLRDPEKRMIDEFLWFWPEKRGGFDSDAAMEALSHGDQEKAENIWTTRESDSNRAAVATHNLAIAYHLLALELEDRFGRNPSDEQRRKDVDRSWTESVKRWKRLFDESTIWDRLRERVEHLSDHALTTGFIHRMRQALPHAIASINGQLALSYASKANIDRAHFHVQTSRTLQPDPKQFGVMAEAILAPLNKRLREHLSRTTERVKGDVPSTLTLLRELLDDAKNVLEFTLLFFSCDEIPNKDLLEKVAVECNRLPKPYFEANGDNKGCLELIRLALPLAYSTEAREQITRSIETLTHNLDYQKYKAIIDLLGQIDQGKQSPAVKLEWFLRDAKPKLTAAIGEKTEGPDDSLWETLDLAAIVLKNISLAAWNTHKDLKTE